MNVDALGQQLQLELRAAAETGRIETSDDDEPSAKRPKLEPRKKSTTIKMEPIEIDDESPSTKRAIKVEEDDELEKLEAEERKLGRKLRKRRDLRR
jgi:hypothetical protein